MLYQVVKKASESIEATDAPTFPRKRKWPNYAIFQYVIGYEGPANNDYHLATAYDYYKQIYFEGLDAITNAISSYIESNKENWCFRGD